LISGRGVMNEYQAEQIQAIQMARQHMEMCASGSDSAASDFLALHTGRYLAFRKEVSVFFGELLEHICSQKCYGSRLSACCTKDGIIVFWADVVINVQQSSQAELDRLEMAIKNPAEDHKCIFLTRTGCAWRIKPIICEMFLCTEAESVFESDPLSQKRWEELKALKKTFTWPDRPVLFELLERPFIEAGLDSPLMYMHKSPGLLRMIQRRNH
jgi:hypothetical protein